MIRLLDIALALVAVLLLSPLLVAVTVVLRMTGEGESFIPAGADWQVRPSFPDFEIRDHVEG